MEIFVFIIRQELAHSPRAYTFHEISLLSCIGPWEQTWASKKKTHYGLIYTTLYGDVAHRYANATAMTKQQWATEE